MRDGLYPLVPVLVHHIGDNPPGCLRQVLIFVLAQDNGTFVRYLGNQNNFLSVRREEEILNLKFFTFCILGSNLFCSRSISVHHPYRTYTVFGSKVCNLVASVYPNGSALALGRSCKNLVVRPVRIHQADYSMAAVFLNAIVRDIVEDFASVRRRLHPAYTAHSPKGFRSHKV